MDGRDWWFRRRLDVAEPAAGEELVLAFDGLASVVDVYLDGRLIHQSQSMFEAAAVEIGGLAGRAAS